MGIEVLFWALIIPILIIAISRSAHHHGHGTTKLDKSPLPDQPAANSPQPEPGSKAEKAGNSERQ